MREYLYFFLFLLMLHLCSKNSKLVSRDNKKKPLDIEEHVNSITIWKNSEDSYSKSFKLAFWLFKYDKKISLGPYAKNMWRGKCMPFFSPSNTMLN